LFISFGLLESAEGELSNDARDKQWDEIRIDGEPAMAAPRASLGRRDMLG
jgi:hypothetical protein